MKWILTFVCLVSIGVLAAESSAQTSVCVRCLPPAPRASIGIYAAPVRQPPPVMIQAVPVQPAPVMLAVPATIQVQTMIPQARPRCCGLLRRVASRLFHRRNAYVMGPTLQYTLEQQKTEQ